MQSLDSFVSGYDAMMFDPRTSEIYGGSGFYNVGYWVADTADQPAACRNLVDRLLRPVPAQADRVLDVGCGCGGSTRAVKALRPLAGVTGINISARQLLQARGAVPDCDFGLMDAAALGFADASFDVVISVEAAFHFRTRAGFLAEAFRVLRPGGWLALSDILFRDARWLGAWMVPEANAVAGPDAYAALLLRTGFRDVALVDATQRCWIAFCRRRLAAIAAQRSSGALSEDAFVAQSAYFTDLIERTLGHYLLAFARKPVNQVQAVA